MSIRYRSERKKYELSFLDEGKRRRLLFDSKREAAEFSLSGERMLEKSITLERATQIYYENVSKTKSRQTACAEKRYFNMQFHFLTREKNLNCLSQISYSHMLSFQKWMSEPKVYDGKQVRLSESTVNRAFNSIKHFYVHWVRAGELQSSPCAHLRRLEFIEKERRPMTLVEFEQAYAEAPVWFKPAMLFIHLTGSAPISIERLKKSDIDLENRTYTLTRRKGKSARWRRETNPMSDALFLLLSSVTSDHEFVFSSEKGAPLTADWCSKVGNRAIKRAGLGDVVLYCMRHALASDLVSANVSLQTVSKLLGHANIRTTQRYAKPDNECLVNALRLVR